MHEIFRTSSRWRDNSFGKNGSLETLECINFAKFDEHSSSLFKALGIKLLVCNFSPKFAFCAR